jgi:hypothetical protein
MIDARMQLKPINTLGIELKKALIMEKGGINA